MQLISIASIIGHIPRSSFDYWIAQQSKHLAPSFPGLESSAVIVPFICSDLKNAEHFDDALMMSNRHLTHKLWCLPIGNKNETTYLLLFLSL